MMVEWIVGALVLLACGGLAWIVILGCRACREADVRRTRFDRALMAGSIAGMSGGVGDNGPCAVFLRELTKP